MSPADVTTAPAKLAEFLDAHGHRVSAAVTRSGLLVILTVTPSDGIRSGQPCLTPANARELAAALTVWANLAPEGLAS